VVFPVAPAVSGDWEVDLSRVVAPRRIRGLGNGLCFLLGVTAAALLLWVVVPDLGLLALPLSLACVVVTLVWLYRARMNAEGLVRHRRSKGWVVGGWFCPVVNLWFPLQVVEDVSRADLPGDRRGAAGIVLYGWWACWLLAWFTGASYRRTRVEYADGGFSESVSVGAVFGGTGVSRVFGAAAAILLGVVVYGISMRQERRALGPGRLVVGFGD
jgi:hypothetical protein